MEGGVPLERTQMNIPVPARPVRVSRERLVLAAFVCLLLVAAGLRFYDLPGDYLRGDEKVAAYNSSGTLSEVVHNTRIRNSSPLLYPLALWAVKKVDVSAFSLRVLPATASVLTVAVMLFFLPCLGMSRWATFLAALLATLSVAAIEHAQDAREYSIDALLAALMIAGLLWYLRDGRKALLCLSLFLAPLLQYGLVLFGVALMSAATVLPPLPTPATPEGDLRPSRIRHWFQRRIALVWPAGCFLAGCAISYAVTLRYQWQEGGFASKNYLQKNYYQGKFEAHSIFEFSIDGTWGLLTYHLPWVVATAVLVAFALLLVAAFLRRFQGNLQDSAIAVLFLLCIAVSVGAALLGIYPLGGIRQVIYLGPVIFLAAGVSIHWIADSLAALTRRAWVAPMLAAAVVGAIALAGVGDLWRDSPYLKTHATKAILAFLKEHVEEGDMVYANAMAARFLKLYQDEKPGNYYYGKTRCADGGKKYIQEMADFVISQPNVPNRIFWVHECKPSLWDVLEPLGEQFSVERVIDRRRLKVDLIMNARGSVEAEDRSAYEALATGKPVIRSDFDVYLSENTLVYVREACDRADTEATFFLHLIPADVADLPDHRKQYGFDNLDFTFRGYGVALFGNGKCVAARAVPEYDITRISTGQYVPVAGGFNNLWKAEFPWREGK